ncbi:MAG TPA: hypothetical protein VHN12_14415 [Geobacteraceae bacterium]|nr:hypothetical protein [Geobacteraceae bacterium]
MAIMVQFNNNTASFIPDYDLRELILSNSIIAFRRGTGWVVIGAAPIRGEGGSRYDGPERKGAGARSRYDGPERRGAEATGEVWKRIRITELR